MNILVTGIYFFIQFGHILKGNLVCKEMKSIVETVSKDASSFKTIVTAKPQHLINLILLELYSVWEWEWMSNQSDS